MNDYRSERPDRGERGDRGDRAGDKVADAFKRGRRRGCAFCGDTNLVIDYKDPALLRYFISDRGKITPARITGNCAKHQRALTLAVKRARNIALMPFTTNE